MMQYLKSLGEMANVAERLLNVEKWVGLFDKGEQEENKLRKVIVESRQLALKYNLLKSNGHNITNYNTPRSNQTNPTVKDLP